MKQTIFETRERAKELLREAINIWQNSDDNDKLEGLENDPILKIMLTALAYQANESISDLEAMKTEVLEEYAQLLTPFEVGHAMPATAVISTMPQGAINELEMDTKSIFTLVGSNNSFLPLLKTRVLNAKVHKIARVDGRRWSVTINLNAPIKSLAGFAFAIKNQNYYDLKVTVNNQKLPIIKPWEYSELPLNDCFGLDTVIYTKAHTYNASTVCMDLFARQNTRIYVVRPEKTSKFGADTESFDLIIEFSGISDQFKFDMDDFVLNPVVLVNAELHHYTLSAQTPLLRVDNQFLHAVRPPEEQMYGRSLIEVRRVAADRFNQGRLIKLLNAVIARYHSDYYAYQDIKGLPVDKMMQALQEMLTHLVDNAKKEPLKRVAGTYIMLRDAKLLQSSDGSLEIGYLTTDGAGVNSLLNAESTFTVPSGLSSTETVQIATPVMGYDEITDASAQSSLSRYYIATNNRIVTQADIKLFCYNELLTRYGIVRDMVKSLTVSRRHQMETRGPGYEIVVEITLADNQFIKRSMSEKVSQVEVLLQKMIEVRSTNIYPIVVMINIEN